MKISAISHINTFTQTKVHNRNIFNNQSDCFVQTSPAFKGCDEDKSFANFEKWCNETDFLSKVSDIVEKSGRIIGSGFEGVAYEIPNNEQWIVKKYKRSYFIPRKTEAMNIEECPKPMPDINVGQCIAFVNMPCGANYTTRYHILQKQDGEALGVKYQWADVIDESNISSHLSTLKTIAEAPESTYKKLVDDIEYISSQGYDIDASNPQNFLFDEKTNRINFVDINDLMRREGTNYGEVLFAILDGIFAINLLQSQGNEEAKEQTKELSDIIINKYFSALSEKGVKMTSGMFFDKLLEAPTLDRVLQTSDKEEKISALKARNLM